MSRDQQSEPGFGFYGRAFGLVAVAILGLLLYRVVEPFLAPLAWATVLGYLMHPLQSRLTRALRGRAGLAALLLTAVGFVVLIGPLMLVGGAFATQVGALVGSLQRLVAELKINSVEDLVALPAAQTALVWLEAHLAISADQLRGWLVSGAEQALQPLAALGGRAFLGALGTVVSFTMTMFLLFFFLRDGRRLYAAALGLVPLEERRKQRLAHHMGDVTRAVVFGTLATSVLQGISVAIGFELVGLPSPIVFGVAAAVLSVLPVGGTAFVWGPGAAWLLATGHGGAGAFLLLWGTLIVGLADNLLRPLLISGRSQVPTLAVFVGVLGGLGAFGMVGMFLGPLVISLAVALVRFADESLASR
ncbi:MAG TPA: AI-2E family transporter [Steroidobacteraceae bacterium]|nr:AI-2E family transporter [Steroidobacteraceae bacterium]